MRYVFLLLTVFCASPALAKEGDYRFLTQAPALWLPAEVSRGDIEGTISGNLKGWLSKFYPAGKVKNYNVQGHGTWAHVQFDASKNIGPFTKTAHISAVANKPSRFNCAGGNGFILEFDLRGSDGLVKENATAYRLEMCVREKPGGSHEVVTRAFLKEGDDFGGKTGDATVGILKGQVWPLMLALNSAAKQSAVLRGVKLAESLNEALEPSSSFCLE